MNAKWLAPRTFARRSFISSAGQGMVEYILLIVVVISVALAVSAALFKPFDEWARNYIGDYIYCLLDEAELPALGGESSISECERSFEEFTFGGGRPARTTDSEGGGDSDGGGGDQRGARSRLNNSDDGGGGAAGAGGRNRRSAIGLGSGFDGGAGSSGPRTTDVSDQFSKRNNRGRSGGYGRGSYEISSNSPQYSGISGMLEQEKEKAKRKEDKVSSVGRTADLPSSFSRGKVKVAEVVTPQRKREDFDLTAGDWSFGDMFRMLLIIVIIIALVLFVGSQVMQISKSMEKGE